MVIGAIVLVLVYTAMIAGAGGRGLFDTLSVDPWLLGLPLLATLLSYLTMSFSYEGITRAAGGRISSRDMLRITFVANTANYIIPTGGLSGFALRLVMLTKKNIAGGKAVLISFTQTLLTNMMLLLFIMYGLITLVASRDTALSTVVLVSGLVTLLAAFLALCFSMMYHESLRARFLAWAMGLGDRVLVRFTAASKHSRRMHRALEHMAEGMEFFAANPRAMARPVFWIFLDWMFTVGILYAAFYSVGYEVSYSQVVVAFSVAIVFAVMSFVPGGVGVLEGSLALTFKSVGVPLEASILPIFIFRVCFYVVPALLSLALARGAFTELDDANAEEFI